MLFEALGNSAEIIAGVLGIAVTVVAIIVELAATRYNHRITHLFIREPVNYLVLGFFVLTTLMCIWVSAFSEPGGPPLVHGVTLGMISLSLLALLPYFAFVFSFISPLSVIRKLTRNTLEAVGESAAQQTPGGRERAARSIEEIQDVLCSAIDASDRDIAMRCVDDLFELLVAYTREKDALPDGWFDLGEFARQDPDFVSLEPSVIERISAERSWFEYKVLSDYYTALGLSIPRMRDVANLISMKTRQLAVEVAEPGSMLLRLCQTNFNSYLRSAINLRDPRTAYYLLSQYRMVAERFVDQGDGQALEEVVRRFQFYGQLGFNMGQPFLLEVCAFDLVQLLGRCLERWPPGVEVLLNVLLELDQEIRSEAQIDSLTGVRLAQIQAATMLLHAGHDEAARRVIDDLAGETQLRMNRLIRRLEQETDAQYWELAPRGINFSYLAPELRAHLPTIRESLWRSSTA